MAGEGNGNAGTISQPLIPIFNGGNYEFWSIKMKTLFKSQDLWDLVENGYADPYEGTRLKENRKKDNKTLFFIQQAVHESVFSRIAASTTSQEAWKKLQTEFQGSVKVKTMKLQNLRQDFETLLMKSSESIEIYLTRVSGIVSQMNSYGETPSDQTIVSKVLRSLTPKFDHVVAAIEESKDLSIFSFDELKSSLKAHEARINRSLERHEEKAFQVGAESSNQRRSSTVRGRGRGGFRGRGRGRGQGRGRSEGQAEHKQGFNEQKGNKSSIQCYHCKKYGHKQENCWLKEKQSNYAEEEEGSKLFMAYIDNVDVSNNIWFVDSGCSNHMCGMKENFKELDESCKIKVKLGDDKLIQVEGKGIVAVKTSNGKMKLIYDVYYVPALAHNLLSVGQLMASGYSVLFDDGSCVIKDKKSGQPIANVCMTENKMFPLEVSNLEDYAMVAAGSKNEGKLWHLRYGHLNVRGLKVLSQKGMVLGLPKIDSFELCEGCVYGKQKKESFTSGVSWRA